MAEPVRLQSLQPVIALVQARMGSSRLPGKVLLQAAGQSLLAHLVQRLLTVQTLTRIVITTTTDPGDDAIVHEAQRLGVSWFRGSEHDVLDRFARAASQVGAATVVRITADCPLMDPAEVERVVQAFLSSGADYATNQLPNRRRVPLGLAVEVMTNAALQRAAHQATTAHCREHVTPYLYEHSGRFAVYLAEFVQDLSQFRLTVDTPEDFTVVAAVLDAVSGHPRAFALDTAVQFLRANPEIAAINAEIRQKSHTEAAGMVLLVRADASVAGGSGHVMRTLGLAEAWQRRGGRAVVASMGLPLAFSQRFGQRGIEVVAVAEHLIAGTSEDAQTTAGIAQAIGAKVVVVDGYAFDHNYLKTLAHSQWRLTYIDDYGDPACPADIVLMPNAGAEPPIGHQAPLLLAGAPYTPVRSDFRDAARPLRMFDRQPRHLLLTFGGSDPAAMSARAVPLLVQLAQQLPLRVTLLLGAAHPDAHRLAQLSDKIAVLHDVSDMPTLLADVDLACTAAGTTCWELATLGVPMLLVPVADNQATVVRGITASGAGLATDFAWNLSDDALLAALQDFVRLPAARLQAMSLAGCRLIDGRGADRICDALATSAAELSA
ncbi:MAG: UDP-2,4-diacetamido-2,4,6-trideoxy-beta-L-altropyranose hydrolase [Myxococcales bacterium]|nr:UDP-2,4-diacetamido-2,4,6-trideoxy-beta-L-altropyranose hydrolase [Myxococcales bacterium]